MGSALAGLVRLKADPTDGVDPTDGADPMDGAESVVFEALHEFGIGDRHCRRPL